jgi:hypothetical protein
VSAHVSLELLKRQIREHTCPHTAHVCAMRIQCVCLLVADSRRAPTHVAHGNLCECSLQFLTYILHEHAHEANTVCIIVFHVSQISGIRLHMVTIWVYPVIIHSSRCSCDIPYECEDL